MKIKYIGEKVIKFMIYDDYLKITLRRKIELKFKKNQKIQWQVLIK